MATTLLYWQVRYERWKKKQKKKSENTKDNVRIDLLQKHRQNRNEGGKNQKKTALCIQVYKVQSNIQLEVKYAIMLWTNMVAASKNQYNR